jgi:DNA-binding transcriptional regulator GbsR (MarR family)
MTYLTKEFCKEIQKKCVATSCKLLIEINNLKSHDENINEIENIKKKLTKINNIMENIEKYLLLLD